MNVEAIQSKDGNTYWVEQGDTLYAQRLQAGQYQKSNWQFAQTVLPKFRRCIDIGSNNGCNAVNYAQRFSTVECFEPTPLAIELWRRTIRDCKTSNANLHTVALAEQSGVTEIIIHKLNGGHNHLSHYDKNPRTKIQNLNRNTVTVQTATLDSFAFTDVDFIKIDVEGYEYFVLQGAENTININRPLLQLEIVSNQCYKFNYHAENLIEYLRAKDYRACSKRDGWLDGVFTSKGRSIYHNNTLRKGDMDLFFVPAEWNHLLEPQKELFEW